VAADPNAEVTLRGCSLVDNRGRGLITSASARVRQERVTSEGNGLPDLLDVEVETSASATTSGGSTDAGAGDGAKGGRAERASQQDPPVPPDSGPVRPHRSEHDPQDDDASDEYSQRPQRGAAQPDGLARPAAADSDDSALNELLAELDALTGLASVKAEIKRLVSLQKVAEQRRQAGLPPGPAIGWHMVFAGPPGTGKTTVARLYGKLLANLGVVTEGQVVEVSRADLVSENIGGTARLTTAAVNRARGGVLFIDEAYALARESGGTDFGQEAIDTLVKLMEDHRDEFVVIVAGYPAEMRTFLSANPGLRSRISRTIEFGHYSPAELLRITDGLAQRHGLRLAHATSEALLHHFQVVRRDEHYGNGRAARRIFEAAYERQAQRLADTAETPSLGDLTVLLPEDLDPDVTGPVARFGASYDGARIEAVLSRLNALIGLANVKREIDDLLALLSSARRRREAGLEVDASTKHLIFAGPPGTGKTTVARLYGELLAALGILAQGHVIEVARSDLVGKYVGHTARQTAEAFDRARGGVLFIDEAYTLSRPAGSGHDFGQEAIDTLVKLTGDRRDEVVVIAAGYTDEMAEFIASNPGLGFRFAQTLIFPPYTVAELAEIFVLRAKAADYHVPEHTRTALLSRLEAERDRLRQGNAREVGTLLTSAITAHARRTEQLAATDAELTKEQMTTLLPEDVMGTA
jgi:SpoVK/Ycf46/Vps4 family AAA+-type ATPase